MSANHGSRLLYISNPKSLLTSNMENLNDRVNFDLKNLDRVEDVMIPNSKTLIYCHGWAANSGWCSKTRHLIGWSAEDFLITKISWFQQFWYFKLLSSEIIFWSYETKSWYRYEFDFCRLGSRCGKAQERFQSITVVSLEKGSMSNEPNQTENHA